jgi:hypothetical protein
MVMRSVLRRLRWWWWWSSYGSGYGVNTGEWDELGSEEAWRWLCACPSVLT